jgi:hypothetical protein
MRVFMRRLILGLLPALFIVAPLPLRAQGADGDHVAAELKRMQIRMMREGAMREMREARERRAQLKREALRDRTMTPAARRAIARGEGRRPVSFEPPDPAATATTSATTAGQAMPASLQALATNHIANNRATDTPGSGSGQCEVSIAAFGTHLVAAWNDGQGFISGQSTQGFAYSNDNGVTWIDGGTPPTTTLVPDWTSDPVVVVNEKTGAFYFSALFDSTTLTNGIAVVKGTFTGGTFSWGTPRRVISGPSATVVFDKEWMAVDSLTGNLYTTYTKFTTSGDEIDFARNTTDNAGAWAAPIKLSSTADNGLVQGSRVSIGPAGEVWTVWNAINLNSPFSDFMRVKKAPAGGTVFGAEVTAASVFSNYGTGAPGFNRGTGYTFPGIAVDRGSGPHRGRVYLTWNESINFYNDNFAVPTLANQISETDNAPTNDIPANADAFTVGKNLVGTISTTSDLDYWSFTGTQGQTIIAYLDTVYTTTLDCSFRLFCSDQATRLAYSESGFGGFDNASALIVFTLPQTGTYYLRVASTTDNPAVHPLGTGTYRIKTIFNGPITERARDHRDIFVTSSDNGTTWTTPVRVNGDPPHLDDWLPEVAVAPNGDVFCQWYDWRDAPAAACNGGSMIYLSRSTDGGATWPDGSPVTDQVTMWTNVNTNIIPNQGDYTSLFVNANAAYSMWSDGRNGDPDAFMAPVNLGFTPVAMSLVSTLADPDRVRITWYTGAGAGAIGTVYRRSGDETWTALEDVLADGSGEMTFEDRAVTPGTSYTYRLGLHDASGETFSDEVTIDVPLRLAFGLRAVGANPAQRVEVEYSLPEAGAASVELIDVAGRRIDEKTVTGPGAATVELGGRTLPAGVYLVRLTHAGRSATTRVAVIR